MAVAMKTTQEPTVFTLEAPLLAKGRSMDLLAKTNLMAAHIKVYASGGENGLHAHPHEDHMFVVLDGEATFNLGVDEKEAVVRKHQGILLPRGAYYRFASSGNENLVLLRIGAWEEGSPRERIKPDGSPIPGDSADNKYEGEPVTIPGQFFR